MECEEGTMNQQIQKYIADTTEEILSLSDEIGSYIASFSGNQEGLTTRLRGKILLGKCTAIKERLCTYQQEIERNLNDKKEISKNLRGEDIPLIDPFEAFEKKETFLADTRLVSLQLLAQNLLMIEQYEDMLQGLNSAGKHLQESEHLVQRADKIVDLQKFKEALKREEVG